MLLRFYGSKLCPRCRQAKRHLYAAISSYPELQIEEIESLQHPLMTIHAGIRMIPAIQANNTILSGVYLSKKAIERFVSDLSTKA